MVGKPTQHLIIYVIGLFFSTFGIGLQFIALTWILYEMTGDATYTGVLIGLGFVPSLMFNLFFGTVIDRSNRKVLAVLSNGIIAFSASMFFIWSTIGSVEIWMIMVLHLIVQLSGSLYRPSIQAFLAEIFEQKSLPRVYSISGSVGESGALLGASLGGILIAFLSPYYAIGINALFYLISIFTILPLKRIKITNRVTCQTVKNSMIKDFVSGFHYLNNHRLLYQLFGMMFVGQLVMHTSIGMLSVYTIEHLNSNSYIYGFLEATISLGGIISGILATWYINKLKQNITIGGFLIILFSLLLVSLNDFLPVVFVGMFLIGVGTTLIRVLLQSVQQVYTDPAYHGRMASFRMVMNQGSVVVGAPILGIIAEGSSIQYSYLTLCFPVFIATIYAVYLSKRITYQKVIHTMVS